MTLAPLLNASTAIQIHAAAALAAFLIGAVQLIGVKGTGRHRALGYVWVSLMLVVALSAFWIHEINQLGGYSAIHLLSVLTLITAPLAVLAARTGRIARHRTAMISLFFGALVIAGTLAMLPGRIMGRVIFGG
jgi:uncharacterized membrane protein